LAQLQEQADRWADSYSRGVMTEKQFVRFSQKLEVDEQEMSSRLEHVEAQLSQRSQREAWLQQVQQALLDFPLIWAELDNDEKRQLLLLLLEEKGLRLDRYGRDILVKIKLHLLPEKQRTIIYRSYRGTNKGKHTGEQRLTKTQMTLLYHEGTGKDAAGSR
jgi:hypothetical protein